MAGFRETVENVFRGEVSPDDPDVNDDQGVSFQRHGCQIRIPFVVKTFEFMLKLSIRQARLGYCSLAPLGASTGTCSETLLINERCHDYFKISAVAEFLRLDIVDGSAKLPCLVDGSWHPNGDEARGLTLAFVVNVRINTSAPRGHRTCQQKQKKGLKEID